MTEKNLGTKCQDECQMSNVLIVQINSKNNYMRKSTVDVFLLKTVKQIVTASN